jgi:hypothetical protein
MSGRRRPPALPISIRASPVPERSANLRVATQAIRIRKREPGEDGRRAKRRAGLPPALGAVAYVQCQRFRQRRLERHSTALTASLHVEGQMHENWIFLAPVCSLALAFGDCNRLVRIAVGIGEKGLLLARNDWDRTRSV